MRRIGAVWAVLLGLLLSTPVCAATAVSGSVVAPEPVSTSAPVDTPVPTVTVVPSATPDPVATPAAAPHTLTPDGQLTLLDDLRAGDLEFMSVQTRDGHVFYLIVDRGGFGDNVYFLNEVDDADLQALTGEKKTGLFPQATASPVTPSPVIDSPVTPSPIESPTPESMPQPTRPVALYALAFVVIAGGGAGVFLWRKKRSGKPAQSAARDVEEYDAFEFETAYEEAETPEDDACDAAQESRLAEEASYR